MKMYNELLKKLWQDEEGATAVEYGIIIAIIAIALGGALAALKPKLTGAIKAAGDQLGTAAG